LARGAGRAGLAWLRFPPFRSARAGGRFPLRLAWLGLAWPVKRVRAGYLPLALVVSSGYYSYYY